MPRYNIRTAYEKEKQAPFFSRSSADPLAAWRISGIKDTQFEQWYFDSVSSDGKCSFSTIFARDPSYAALGYGNLRMEFDAILPDGSHFQSQDFMSEAALQDGTKDIDGRVKGMWTGAGKRYSFDIAGDGATARADFEDDNVRGWIKLTSTAPAHYASGQTQAEAGSNAPTELCPKIHLVEVIPNGTFECELIVGGKKLKFTGIGGHMHVWAEDSWFKTVRRWRMSRGAAGPYGFSLMQWTSLVDGKTYSSGFVACRGKKAFGGKEIGEDLDNGPEDGKTVARWLPLYNVGITGKHADKSSGAMLRFKGEHEYEFQLSHTQIALSVNFGGGDSGLTGFHCRVSGGEVGGESFDGVAFANVCVLPQGWTMVYFFLCMILAKVTFGYVNLLGNGYT